MCGICGIFNFDGRPCDPSDIQRMNDQMRHRGPDGDGIYTDGGIGLGHRRLSIIDLEAGKQPMGNADGSVQVVFNGEIYNFLELKKDLESRGYVFRTRSDTETILYAYEVWGEDFVDRLRGMFAIALWEGRHQRLVLARDRIGKKPLYYAMDGSRIVFASELKAILALRDIQREMNLEALDAYLSFGYVPSPLCIIKGVHKLPPAHMAVVAKSQDIRLRRYWRLNMQPDKDRRNEPEAIEELAGIFDEAVKLRLISDVPLGAFLSGGVDSSAVVAAMSLIHPGEPVKTASIGFADKQFDEIDYSRIVAKQYGTDHSEFIVDPDALGVLEKIVWHLDEPFADASAIPTYYVSQMARRKVTVALSGDGGDETFAGYVQRYRMNAIEDRIRSRLPASLRTGVLGPLANRYPRVDNLPRPLRLKRFLMNVSMPHDLAYCRDMSFYFQPEMKQRLYRPEVLEKVGQHDAFAFIRGHFDPVRRLDAVTRAQYMDMMTYLPEDILVKVDRMSMANSLEVRAPILDHRLMEFVARLPASFKLKERQSKYIFKKMNEQRLPSEILYRKKQGFCVPLANWLRGELKTYARDTLFSKENGLSELFNSAYIDRLWTSHQKGVQDNATPLWGLMMVGLWYERFLG